MPDPDQLQKTMDTILRKPTRDEQCEIEKMVKASKCNRWADIDHSQRRFWQRLWGMCLYQMENKQGTL